MDTILSIFSITLVYGLALLLLILSIEIFFTNIMKLSVDIPFLNNRFTAIKIISIVSRRILINFHLNLIVNLLIAFFLTIVLSFFTIDGYENMKAIFIFSIIFFNIMGLYVANLIYEKTKFSLVISNKLNEIVNSNLSRIVVTFPLKWGYSIYSFLKKISIFLIKKVLPNFKFKSFMKSEKKNKSESSLNLPILNYFDNESFLLSNTAEREKAVNLLDTLVLILTAVGLLITSSILSSGISESTQYLFIIFFISVILTKATANHEKISNKTDIETLDRIS